MKGLISFIIFIILNIILCVIVSYKRKKSSQKIDLFAIFSSAIIITIFIHIIAIIEDINSTQWIFISIPIAFTIGFFSSLITSIILQRYFMQKDTKRYYNKS